MALTTVTGSLVSVNAIQGTLIADNAITAVHIATNAVSGTLIADNAVTAVHIAQNSITVTQLADDCVESDKIADGIITTNHLNKAMISSQTEVTAATGDFVLLGDTSDSNNLKKTPVSSIIGLASGTTINNNADNRIITGSGTANTLEGESGLTYDGSTLAVTGDANFDSNTLFVDASANAVGIGTSSPNSKTHIVGAANGIALRVTNAAVDGNNADVMHIEPSNGAYYGKLLRIQSGRSDFSDSLLFLNTTTGMNGTNGSYMRVQNNSGADIFRIRGDGNVGIGTTAPERALHIVGGLHLENDNKISWDQANGTLRNAIYVDSGDDMIIGDTNFDDIYFSTGGKTKTVVIKQTTGNVGIGTTSPSELLEVSGTEASGSVELLLTNIGDGGLSTTPYTAIRSRLNPTRNGGEIRFGRDSNYGDAAGADSNIQFYTALDDTNTERMRITSAGNVGIGTTSPSTELHVYSADQNALKIQTNTGINQIELANSTNSPTYITANSYALVLKADDNGWGGTASAIKFNVKGAEKARVTPDGVAMGDTDGDYTHRGATGGLHIKRGGLLMNGPPGNANMSSATNGNQWTYHGQGGRGGSFTSLTISVPNPNNGASGVGYGGFSLEFYIAGYNAKYHSGHFAGYVNGSIVLSKRAFWDSSGSGTLTSGSVGAQGFYLTIGFPSMTHPTCKFVINKGGHGGSAGNAAWTDIDGVSVTWA